MRRINRIILHCTATPEGRDVKAATIKKWHVEDNGWSDIGYHYIIDLDGTIEKGRSEDISGAHCQGYNKYSIGICYVGGIDMMKRAKDTRTPAQKASILKLVNELMMKYNLGIDRVFCHNQLSKKACPSFKIDTFRKEYKEYKEWQER